MASKVWQALSEVLGTLHRLASFAHVAIHEAIGNGLLRDALQEVGDPTRLQLKTSCKALGSHSKIFKNKLNTLKIH